MIREIQVGDLEQLKWIHAKYYKDQFEFPDFLEHFLCVFTVTDNSGSIITTGGVRTVIESIAITDQSRSVRVRRRALYELLAASQYVISKSGYEHLHAFIQDEKWYNHLLKIGFVPTKGKALVIGS